MSLTAEQLAARRMGIGGSEIAAVLGESRFASPFDVWLSKTQGWRQEENEDMRRGTFLEAGIADWYAQRLGVVGRLKECSTVIHASQSLAMCTPDRLVLFDIVPERRILSIKSPRRKSEAWGEEFSDRIPQEYALQLQWEFLVLSSHMKIDAEMHLAALLDGELVVYSVEPDKELQQWMLEYATSWWKRHVVANVAPPLDGSSQAAAWLKSKYPQDVGARRDATPHEIRLMLELEMREREFDEADSQVELARSHLKMSMMDVARITAPNGTVTWKADKNGKRSFKTNWRKS